MYCIIQSLGRRRGCKMISISIWRLDCYNQQEKAWYLVNSICLRRRQWESAVENQELLNRHLSSYCEQFQCFLFKQGRRALFLLEGSEDFSWEDFREFLAKNSDLWLILQSVQANVIDKSHRSKNGRRLKEKLELLLKRFEVEWDVKHTVIEISKISRLIIWTGFSSSLFLFHHACTLVCPVFYINKF